MCIDWPEVHPLKINRAYDSRALPEALEGNDPCPNNGFQYVGEIKKASQLLERLIVVVPLGLEPRTT